MRRTFDEQKEEYGKYLVVVKENEREGYNSIYYSQDYGKSYRLLFKNNANYIKETFLSKDGNTIVLIHEYNRDFDIFKVDTNKHYTKSYFNFIDNESIQEIVVNKEVSNILVVTSNYFCINLNTLELVTRFYPNKSYYDLLGLTIPNSNSVDTLIYMTDTDLVRTFNYGGYSLTPYNKPHYNQMKIISTGKYPLKILAAGETFIVPNEGEIEYDTITEYNFTFKSTTLPGGFPIKMSEKGIIINKVDSIYFLISNFDDINNTYVIKKTLNEEHIYYVGISDTDDTHVVGTFGGFYFYKNIKDNSPFFKVPLPKYINRSNLLSMATNI